MRFDNIELDMLDDYDIDRAPCDVTEARLATVQPLSPDGAYVARLLMKSATARDQLQDFYPADDVLGVAIMSVADRELPWWFDPLEWALPERVRVFLVRRDACENDPDSKSLFEMWAQIETPGARITAYSELDAEGHDLDSLTRDIADLRPTPFTEFEVLG